MYSNTKSSPRSVARFTSPSWNSNTPFGDSSAIRLAIALAMPQRMSEPSSLTGGLAVTCDSVLFPTKESAKAGHISNRTYAHIDAAIDGEEPWAYLLEHRPSCLLFDRVGSPVGFQACPDSFPIQELNPIRPESLETARRHPLLPAFVRSR